jgi:hypothetical protein
MEELGRREFWFPLRERGAGLWGRRSLLIADRYGVYSFAHRRYIRKTRYQHVDPQPLGNPQRFRICVDELIQPTLQFSFVTNKVLISSLFEVYYCNVWEIKKCNFLLRA